MVIQRIPVYTLKAEKEQAPSLAALSKTDLCVTLPPLAPLADRERTLLSAEGMLSVRLICRSLIEGSDDPEQRSLRREHCFVFNEENEWILDVSFRTVTEGGNVRDCTIRLPLSPPHADDQSLTLWYDGTWMRLLGADGSLLTENSGVGFLCPPCAVEAISGVTVAHVVESRVSYRKETTDTPADLYTPYGFDANVGDVMTFYHDGVYHIAYLIDRRHHGSGGGRGAHYIAHLTTRDLVTWEEQEPIAEIEHPYESFGTGTMFFHEGRYYMSYGLHSSRHPDGKFIEPSRSEDGSTYYHKTFAACKAEGGMPLGATLSVSEDGLHFKKTELLYHASQNPSVYSDKDGGLTLYGGYGGEGVYRTDSIRHPFVRVQNAPSFSGPTTALHCSSECPAFFEMNGYRYLIVGFTGYFRTLSCDSDQLVDAIALGETVYDGLCVPMVAEFTNGRRIIAGWIRSSLGWGSALVQRELISEANGHLGMRWIPELYPEKQGASIPAQADGTYAFPARQCYLFEGEAETDADGVFALNFLADSGAVQLRVDSVQKKAQLSEPGEGGGLADPIDTPYERKLREGDYDFRNMNYTDHFAIPDVALGRRFRLRVLLRYEPKLRTTVADIELGEKRTLLLTRGDYFINGIRPIHGGLSNVTLFKINR